MSVDVPMGSLSGSISVLVVKKNLQQLTYSESLAYLILVDKGLRGSGYRATAEAEAALVKDNCF